MLHTSRANCGVDYSDWRVELPRITGEGGWRLNGRQSPCHWDVVIVAGTEQNLVLLLLLLLRLSQPLRRHGLWLPPRRRLPVVTRQYAFHPPILTLSIRDIRRQSSYRERLNSLRCHWSKAQNCLIILNLNLSSSRPVARTFCACPVTTLSATRQSCQYLAGVRCRHLQSISGRPALRRPIANRPASAAKAAAELKTRKTPTPSRRQNILFYRSSLSASALGRDGPPPLALTCRTFAACRQKNSFQINSSQINLSWSLRDVRPSARWKEFVGRCYAASR